jgi:nucleoside-diphosphate kinase
MALERTFAMIKPDAVSRGISGQIISMIEENGFHIVAMKKHHITVKEAEGFYGVHRERPFFGSLVKFMTEGPSILLVLEKDSAIAQWRELMGATNPANAAEGTVRKRFAESIERNCSHGSDAVETAAGETVYYFSASELL